MASALRRVRRDDPILTHLLICEPPTAVYKEGSHFDVEIISDDGPGIKRICEGIGKNTHLRDICFDAPLGLSDRIARPALFEGLRRNASIVTLGLSRCDLSRGVAHEVLRAFHDNSRQLTKFALWRCEFSRELGGPCAIASTLARCTSLKEISLSSCRVDDSLAEDLARAVRGHRRLTALDLKQNCIGGAGARALAALLQDPACNLVEVNLHDKIIDDIGAEAMANALTNNDKVVSLHLDENYITANGWNAFSDVLCNASSINDTYLSNHTLRSIASFGRDKFSVYLLYDEDKAIPNGLFELLAINALGSSRKNFTARRKIVDCHFNGDFDMMPFAEGNMEVELLPHLLFWVGRSPNGTSRAAMFRLLQRMPTLCAESCAVEGFAEVPRSAEPPHLTGSDVIVTRYLDEHEHSARRTSRLGAILRTVCRAKRANPFAKGWGKHL